MGRVKKLKKFLRQKEIEKEVFGSKPDEADKAGRYQTELQDGQKNNSSRKEMRITKHQGNRSSELTKKKRKQLLKILAKKRKRLDRDEIVNKLTELKQESIRDRKKLSTQKPEDIRSLRKRRITSVQKWGKGVNMPKQARPDVLAFNGSDEEDESTGDEAFEARGVLEESQKAENFNTVPHDTIPASTRKEETFNDDGDDIGDINANIGHLLPMKNMRPIVLNRPHVVAEHRSNLPIVSMEQEITETIATNPVTIICGETGSGKTTQVVQFLYEAGYGQMGLIGITEPRRIAAISTSKRVAFETGLGTDVVSYQVRFEGNCTQATRIKFCTDGVFLKEMEHDLSLSNYSAIIIDEAHERSVHSDIVVGLLSRVVGLREKRGKPLRVIIMSATLRVSDFTQNEKLFKKPPPVINVQSRQFPVTIHFNRTTPKDYMQDAFKKICRIHKDLPQGGILVFVTGKKEVNRLVSQLRSKFVYPPTEYLNTTSRRSPSMKRACYGRKKHFSYHKHDLVETSSPSSELAEDGSQPAVVSNSVEKRSAAQNVQPDNKCLDLEKYTVYPIEDAELDDQVEDDDFSDDEDNVPRDSEEESDNRDTAIQHEPTRTASSLVVLPMYAMLSSTLQQRVFESIPVQSRLCVVATNVAETSLTIPGVRYVIDCGKCKTRVYDKVTGISKFIVTWTSKASAEQRTGRAGRQGPGHCYRLYSSAVFNDSFAEHSPAEITLRPVDALLLQMKCMGIEKVVNFPFPTAPHREALIAAENSLIEIGALDRQQLKPLSVRDRENWLYSSKVTPLGRAMGCFPVSPRFAKMLALSYQDNSLMPFVVTLIAGLTVQEPFVQGKGACPISCKALGDMGRLLAAVGASEFSQQSLCQLRVEAMREIRKMRLQLTEELNLLMPELKLTVDPRMTPPTDVQIIALRQIMLCAMSDRVAKKKHGKVYECMQTDGPVFIHGDSIVSKDQPLWVVFQEISEDTHNKMQLRMLCPIEEHWLASLARQHCVLSEPLEDPSPEYDVNSDSLLVWHDGTYGPKAWKLPKTQSKAPMHWKDRFNWFAKAFLDGQVLESLKKYTKHYVSQPAVIVKKYSAVSQKASQLVAALKQANVCSRKDLFLRWETDPLFLQKQVLDWLPRELHFKLKTSWPPTDK